MRALVMRASLLALAAMIAWQGAGLIFPPKAEAHAVRQRSVPEQNQQLQGPPERIEVWFTEPIDPKLTKIRVLDALGNQVDTGDAGFSDDSFYTSVGVRQDLTPGVYTVVWQNLSKVDGHQFQGFFPFIMLNPDGSVPAAAATPIDVFGTGGGGQGFLPGWSDSALRWVSLLAAVVLAGSVVFYLLVLKPAAEFLGDETASALLESSRRIVFATTAVSCAVLFLSAGGQLALLVDRLGGVSRLTDVLFGTRTGELWLSRLGLAAALGAIALATSRQLVLRLPDWVLPSLLAVGAAGVVMTYALGSHGAAGGGAFAATTSDFVHFLATGVWLGLLAHLAWMWRLIRRQVRDPERLLLQANTLDRFSVLAGVSVGLLLLSGVFNAFVQLPTLEALWETTYGRTLAVKMALVIPLLGVAGINAVLLKPALVDAIDAYEEADEEAQEEPERLLSRIERLRSTLPQTIALELGLGALVLASVAVLTQTATAGGELAQQRAAEEAARVEEAGGHESFTFTNTKIAGDLAVTLRIDPQVVGINTQEMRIASAEGREVGEIQDVSLRFFYDDPAFGSTEDIPAEFEGADDLNPGQMIYELEGAYFSLGGGYRVQIDVQRRGMDDVRAIFPLEVGEAPQERAGLFGVPFDLGTGGIVGATAMLLASVGLLLWRHQFGLLAPWGQRVAEVGGALALLGGVLFAGGELFLTEEGPTGNPIPPTGESVEIGRTVYMRNCMSCHGDAGRGDGLAGQKLNPPPADFLVHVPYHGDSTLFGWTSDGIVGSPMPGFVDQLTEEEMWHVVNFLRKTYGQSEGGFVVPETEEVTPTPTSTPTEAAE